MLGEKAAKELIAGVDEAGRGALIGDVVAAAVILPEKHSIKQLMDSKQLSEKARFEIASEIKAQALAFAIGTASPAEIDKLNIHHATLLAMRRAVEGLDITPNEVWVDGKFTPSVAMTCQAFVKGDSLYQQISAASILAKTHRDTQLIELAKKYPNYGFAQHKGYPTKAHVEAIEKYGVLAEYRKSYKTIRKSLCKPHILDK